MNRSVLCTGIICVMALNPVWATEEEHKSSKEEVIGMGSGAIAGALAGGPIGAVVGAVAGVVLGERFHRNKLAKLDAEAGLEVASERVAGLQTDLDEANDRIRILIDEADQSALEQAIAEGLRFDVLFRTDEAVVQDDRDLQLSEFAVLLAELPNVEVRLDGHADPRGETAFNDELASRRADAVRDSLIEAGLAPERISVHSHGESRSTAPEGDMDAYAFDRRVSITLLSSDVSTVAHNE